MSDFSKFPTCDIDVINLGMMEACGLEPDVCSFASSLGRDYYYWVSDDFINFPSRSIVVNYDDGLMTFFSSYFMDEASFLFECALSDPKLVEKVAKWVDGFRISMRIVIND